MNMIELSFLAVALSMDAVAVAICLGLTMSKFSVKKAVVIGLYFGVFQAVMPLIGYIMGA
jgi:putative Mn2+ efflux pump MntP